MRPLLPPAHNSLRIVSQNALAGQSSLLECIYIFTIYYIVAGKRVLEDMRRLSVCLSVYICSRGRECDSNQNLFDAAYIV